MSKKKVTLSDIAKVANVSIATASMAFSGKGRVSEKVTRKIHKIAQELGYITRQQQPSPVGNGSSSIALLLLTDKKWAYLWYMEQRIVRELEALLARHNYTLILIPITEDDSDEKIIRKVLASGSLGVFSIHYGNPGLFQKLEELKFPVTLIMNSDYQGAIHSVCVDDFHGAYAATRHLIDRGHKQIGFVEYKENPIKSIMKDRYIGFEKALSESGITPNDNFRINIDIHNTADIEAKIESLVSRATRPTAIFAIDDYIAMHFIPVLKRLGISIPRDLSLISPGDVIDYDVPFTPRISTMSINFEQMAHLAVNMLMELLRDIDAQVPSLKVELKLMDRGSTGFNQ